MSDRMPVKPSRGYAPELLTLARQRYEDTDETQDSIAADLGVDRRTLSRIAERECWKLRKDRPPRDLPVALRLETEAAQALGEVAIIVSLR